LKRKNCSPLSRGQAFNFFFANNKLLPSGQLFDYLRKLKNLIFLNNICLTSILQNSKFPIGYLYILKSGIVNSEIYVGILNNVPYCV